MTDPIEMRRKKLLWRANHRGIREMDILLGGFAAQRIADMTRIELDALEALIEFSDQEMLSWITGETSIPDTITNPLLPEFLRFRP
jgi:antitoxin CptB